MVKKTTIKEHNIPKNTCVIVSYSNPKNCIVLWDYDNKGDSHFYSPYITIDKNNKGREGSFRLADKCTFDRYATKEEIKLLQDYLDKEKINFKIKNPEKIYELW
jgi:hypothetical protein